MAAPQEQGSRDLSRREFLFFLLGAPVVTSLFGCMPGIAPTEVPTHESTADRAALQAEILKNIESLNFLPNSELGATLVFRKLCWEKVQLRKARGQWEGGEESAWLEHPELIEECLIDLQKAGITRGRLTIFPFEVPYDGQNFDWSPVDKAVELMTKYGMDVDLAVGPWDYPEAPGMRLPRFLEDQMNETFQNSSESRLLLDTQPDPNFPELSTAIKEFGLKYFKEIISRYTDDSRVKIFAIGNEWPDWHGIEGVKPNRDGKEVTMNVSEDLMLELASMAQQLTGKELFFNTNIHLSEPARLVKVFDRLAELLGEQMILAPDLYPTREAIVDHLLEVMDDYPELTAEFRQLFPEIQTDGIGEFQAEPYMESPLAGRPWAELFKEHSEILIHFFEHQFPQTLQTHIIDGSFRRIWLWTAPALVILADMGYDFPQNMFAAVAKRMGEITGGQAESDKLNII